MLNDYLIFVCIKYSKAKSLVLYSLCWYLCCNFHIDLIRCFTHFLDFLGHRVSRRLFSFCLRYHHFIVNQPIHISKLVYFPAALFDLL